MKYETYWGYETSDRERLKAELSQRFKPSEESPSFWDNWGTGSHVTASAALFFGTPIADALVNNSRIFNAVANLLDHIPILKDHPTTQGLITMTGIAAVAVFSVRAIEHGIEVADEKAAMKEGLDRFIATEYKYNEY